MSSFYTSTTVLIWMSLGVLCLLVHDNSRIQDRDKRLLYLTYLLIALSALAEYCGVLLSGRRELPKTVLLLVKSADYVVTPLAGGAIVLQLKLNNRWNWVIGGLIVLNTLLQLINPLTGWMVTVDGNHFYHHGPLYPIYFIMCLIIIGMVILQFFLYGRSFRQQNRKSLYAILLMILAGILMQELSGGQTRTSYLALTFGATLIFIHYDQFGDQTADDTLRRKQLQLDTDVLTGVYSRYAYTNALNKLEEADALPEDLAVFTVDINGLKQVNDRLGHAAGDELIRGAADCITAAMGKNGRCYRTGGDEFVVLSHMDRLEAERALEDLRWETEHWRGEAVHTLGLAAGFALAKENADLSVEKLVSEADKAMYEAKAAYYRQAGKDRRKRRSEDV